MKKTKATGFVDFIKVSENIKLQIYVDDIRVYGLYDEETQTETTLAINNVWAANPNQEPKIEGAQQSAPFSTMLPSGNISARN